MDAGERGVMELAIAVAPKRREFCVADTSCNYTLDVVEK
jgi:hypothetical protein